MANNTSRLGSDSSTTTPTTITRGYGEQDNIGAGQDRADAGSNPALKPRSSSLSGLPVELIQRIGTYLDPASAANLALTSKDMFQAFPSALQASDIHRNAQKSRNLQDVESVLNALTRHFTEQGANAMPQVHADAIWETLEQRLLVLNHADRIAAFNMCVDALRNQASQNRRPQTASQWLTRIPRLIELCGRRHDYESLLRAMHCEPTVVRMSPSMLADLIAAACVTPGNPAEMRQRHDVLQDLIARRGTPAEDARALTGLRLLDGIYKVPAQPDDGLMATQAFQAGYAMLVSGGWHEETRAGHMRTMIGELFPSLPEPVVDAAMAAMLDHNDFSDWIKREDIVEDLVVQLGRRCAADRNLSNYTRRLQRLLTHAKTCLTPIQQTPLLVVLEAHLDEILKAPVEYSKEDVQAYMRLLLDFRAGLPKFYNLKSEKLMLLKCMQDLRTLLADTETRLDPTQPSPLLSILEESLDDILKAAPAKYSKDDLRACVQQCMKPFKKILNELHMMKLKDLFLLPDLTPDLVDGINKLERLWAN